MKTYINLANIAMFLLSIGLGFTIDLVTAANYYTHNELARALILILIHASAYLVIEIIAVRKIGEPTNINIYGWYKNPVFCIRIATMLALYCILYGKSKQGIFGLTPNISLSLATCITTIGIFESFRTLRGTDK